MDHKLRLKQLISDAINDGYMEFGDANEMFSFIIDSYMDDRDALDTIQEFFPGIGETIESSTDIFIDRGAGLGAPGEAFTLDELKAIYEKLLIEGDEIVNSYASFDEWLDDSCESGLLEYAEASEDQL